MKCQNIEELSLAENFLLAKIISAPAAAPWREILGLQREAAVVTKKTFTGAGFYIDFSVSEKSVVQLEGGAPKEFLLSATSSDKAEGADLVLHLTDGVISCFEVSVSGTRLDVDEVVHWLR